jgi:hypothetical protein
VTVKCTEDFEKGGDNGKNVALMVCSMALDITALEHTKGETI